LSHSALFLDEAVRKAGPRLPHSAGSMSRPSAAFCPRRVRGFWNLRVRDTEIIQLHHWAALSQV
jgi:hypothetical protein